jgi:serine/threonine protein kinase/Tfp pilus assembly protein PilF
MIGKAISNYKILEKLGEGGMGVVYKAEDTQLKRPVALKFLPSKLTSNPEAQKRFIREARAAAGLDHQNICAIYEIDQIEEDQIFIAMAFYEGETLTQKISQGPLKVRDTIEIATQAAEGLTKAHEKGIVHRDIKPANIMITKEGMVKIIDFGLARLKGETRLTKEITTIGTASYMSPEQAEGKEIDHRSDIWSLGVVLYEMVTGQLPFKGVQALGVIYAIVNSEPIPIEQLRPDISPELKRIIHKTLVKDRTQRYQRMEELLIDLERLGQETTAEISSSANHKYEKEKTPLKKVKTLGIIIFIVLIGVIGYFILKKTQHKVDLFIEGGKKPSLAVLYFENQSGDKNLDNWRQAFSELLTTDLSQSKYLRVLRSDQVYSIFKRLKLLEARRYSEEDLKQIAQNGNINRILKGSYVKAGDNFTITATLININTGETITSLSVIAKGEKDIFNQVDDLTKRIKTELNLLPDQIATDIDSRVGHITTSSVEAYQHYLQGIKYHNGRQFYQAIKSFEKAIALDPGFAIAHRKMYTAYFNLGFDMMARQYLEKAFYLRDRVSLRERLHIEETFYRQSERTYAKALETLKQLLMLYPDDLLAHYNIGHLHESLEEWDKAIKTLRSCIEAGGVGPDYYQVLGSIYLDQGLEKKAEAVLNQAMNNSGPRAIIHQELAYLYVYRGEYGRAMKHAQIGESLVSSEAVYYGQIGDIYLCQDNLKKAQEDYSKLMQNQDPAALYFFILRTGDLFSAQGKFANQIPTLQYGIKVSQQLKGRRAERIARYRLAAIHRHLGDYEAALQKYDQVIASADKDGHMEQLRTALLNKGLTYVEMGQLEEAKKIAQQLKLLIENGVYPKSIRYFHHLMGHISLADKKFAKARGYFEEALTHLPKQWAFYTSVLYGLGNTFLQEDNLEEAQQTFETVTSLKARGLGLRFTDMWYGISYGELVSKSHYKLGKVYQRTGSEGKATLSYRKFISLWKECDPRFQPLVEDARQQVALLTGSPSKGKKP